MVAEGQNFERYGSLRFRVFRVFRRFRGFRVPGVCRRRWRGMLYGCNTEIPLNKPHSGTSTQTLDD